MRKILYAPSFGAGWSSWSEGEVAKYMLTYQPIIDFLESGGKFTRADTRHAGNGDDQYQPSHPLLQQLQLECLEKFGEEYVCVLGAHDLRVAIVKGRVRIEEYDGSESYEEEGTFAGWL